RGAVSEPYCTTPTCTKMYLFDKAASKEGVDFAHGCAACCPEFELRYWALVCIDTFTINFCS
uniref:Uncharacterized protein n=1 Tax=Oryzias latipes TaxID=8090 RepID=A0A3P9IMQ4_ORYLA